MTKLSKTMEAALNQLIEAPFVEYDDNFNHFHMNNGETIFRPGMGVSADGTITSRMSSNTLKALAKRNLIEIIEDGRGECDTVRLVQHENTNKSLLETHNLTKVYVYEMGTKGEYNINGKHFKTKEQSYAYTEDGKIENVLAYWETKSTKVSCIVNAETGETMYKK